MAGDKVKGKGEEIKGKIKKKVGDMTDNERMQGEGLIEEHKGKARQKVGEAKDKLKKDAA